MPRSAARCARSFSPHGSSLLSEFAEREAQLIVEEAISSVGCSPADLTCSAKIERAALHISNKTWVDCAYESLRQQFTMRSAAILFIIYAFIISFEAIIRSDGRLMRRAASPPRPFFPQSAKGFVADYYTGNGAHPLVLLQRSEMVVVMYYATWSLESKQARSAFERLAVSFAASPDISFASVNCFFSLGQCKNTYKAHTFPIIVVYVGRLAVMYNGELSAHYMHRWVSYLRSPVRRLNDLREVEKFVHENDNAVIAYFSFKSPYLLHWRYRQFAAAAIFASQYEQLHDKIGFALITNVQLAARLNFSWEGQIRLHQWNRTVEYSHKRNYTGPVIAEWVKDQSVSSSLVEWIVPDSVNTAGSEQLHSILSSGSAIILFTSREPLYPYKGDISVFEQTAMEYFACSEGMRARLRRRADAHDELRRQRTALMFYDRYACRKVTPLYLQLKKCCMGVKRLLRPHCDVCPAAQDSVRVCSRENVFAVSNRRLLAFRSASCRTSKSWLSAEELVSECCLLIVMNEAHPQSLAEDQNRCEVHKLSHQLLYDTLPSSIDPLRPFDDNAVIGLSCNRNNSLRFVAMDLRYYDFLLQKMAISPVSDATAIISDASNEQTLVLHAPFSRKAAREFLRAFHSGSLPRHCATEEHRGSVYVPAQQTDVPDVVHEDALVVHTTSAARFRVDILNGSSGEDIVLLFAGGSWHGATAAIYYAYHTVAHYFRRFAHSIKFFMIDMSRNEVPWNFKMDRLPALLFFPAKRKCSSSRFPVTVPFTVPNVIAFLLARCQPELRWRLALSSCSRACTRRNAARLRHHETLLLGELSALRRLFTSLPSKRTALLLTSLIQRRAAQLRVTRRLRKLTFTLESLSRSQVFREAASLIRDANVLQSILETSLPADLFG